jgi:hypothetical protein
MQNIEINRNDLLNGRKSDIADRKISPAWHQMFSNHNSSTGSSGGSPNEPENKLRGLVK